MSLGLGLLLCTGVALNILSQAIVDTKFAHPSAHVLPWIKFTATFLFACASRAQQGPAAQAPTAQQHRLMLTIGVLDAAAYVSFCIGFIACGAAVASVVLAAAAQVCTALATRFVLRKQLGSGQAAAIAVVCLGLALRALPPAAFRGGLPADSAGSVSAALGPSPQQLWGVACVLLAAVLYSATGVAYEALVTATGKPPRYSDMLWFTSRIGVVAATAYQLLYTLPRWDQLVARPSAAGGVTAQSIVPLLLAFAALFNLHMLAQTVVFRSDGAMGVGLVNAVRGAAITAITGAVFCSPARPALCVTRQSGLSAGVTALGGVAWVVAGARAKRAQQAVAGGAATPKSKTL